MLLLSHHFSVSETSCVCFKHYAVSKDFLPLVKDCPISYLNTLLLLHQIIYPKRLFSGMNNYSIHDNKCAASKIFTIVLIA